VDAYFAETGLAEKGGFAAARKSLIILAWAVASYVLLVFVAWNVWTAALPALSLGLALAGIGFSVMHDGSHGAASRRGWLNRLAGASLDLIGGSSYFWHHKHDVLHHTYTNVDGLDEDIDSAPFLRMAPSQKRRWYHRFQHLYVLFLFAFFVPKWLFVDDFKTWIQGRIAGTRIPRPRGWNAVQLVTGKVGVVLWGFVLPLMFHSVPEVMIGFFVVSWTLGVTLAVTFQLAHVVDKTTFHEVPPTGERLAQPFFEHQVATTCDFAPRNPVVSWYVGGLNFQIEHHLFPRIGHRHYPALAKITREVCEEQGIPYHCNDTLLDALRSHVRALRRLGLPDPVAVAA